MVVDHRPRHQAADLEPRCRAFEHPRFPGRLAPSLRRRKAVPIMIAARPSAHKTDDAGMMNAWSNAYGMALGATLAVSAGPSVAAPDEFYAGKTITVITSGGGAYEAYGRA